MKLCWLTLTLVTLLAACNPQQNNIPAPQVDASGVPIAQPQQAAGYSGMDVAGAAIGGAVLGHMLTGHGSTGQAAPTIIHHTTVVQQTIVRPMVRPPMRPYVAVRRGR